MQQPRLQKESKVSSKVKADAVKVEVPEDPIDALRMRSELVARGIVDADLNGFIENVVHFMNKHFPLLVGK